MLGRAGDDAAGAHVELRAMPGALHRAVDQSSVRERAAAMVAAIADSKDAFGAFGNRNALTADASQHHLAIAQLRLIAHRLVETG